MAGAITVIIAPPSACSTRDARRVENCPVKSGRNPQVKDPTVKSINPIRNIFLNPITSDIFPMMSRHPAITSR
jgi:hypothetical protein